MHAVLDLGVADPIEVVLVGLERLRAAPPLHVLDQLAEPALDLGVGRRALVDLPDGHRDVPVPGLMDIGVDAGGGAGGVPGVLAVGLGGERGAPRAEEERGGEQIGSLARGRLEEGRAREAARVEGAALGVDVAAEELGRVAGEAEELDPAAVAALAERGGVLEQPAAEPVAEG